MHLLVGDNWRLRCFTIFCKELRNCVLNFALCSDNHTKVRDVKPVKDLIEFSPL